MLEFFKRHDGGSTATTFAMVLPILATLGVGGIDYAMTFKHRSSLQEIADAASTGAAKELVLGATDQTRVKAVAEEIVANGLSRLGLSGQAYTVTATAIDKMTAVKVDLTQATQVLMTSVAPDEVSVTSTARLSGIIKLCVLALDEKNSETVFLRQSAKITANGCAVISNSANRDGIHLLDSAALAASFVCTAGGAKAAAGQITPAPLMDCPTTADPLADRKPPTVGACTETNKDISSGMVTLMPGVYCGGLKIRGTAVVDLKPGIYVIKDGALTVTDTATLRGRYVGFYLAGASTVFEFTKDSVIDLGAPKDGAMAGLLFFEDRAGNLGKTSRITSDYARKLIGTVYLSRGEFMIDSTRPVADKSEYTAMVVRKLSLQSGPDLVVNSDYEASDVPVPTGLGTTTMSAKVYVAQ